MAVITYTAKREISGGRTLGNSYKFEIGLKKYDYGRSRQVRENISLSGNKFTTFHRVDLTRSCQTVPFSSPVVVTQMIEFMASTEGGEAFYIDELGTIASPVFDETCELKGDYKVSRVGRADRYQIDFEVIIS
jgi:hypothetical protein